MDENNITQDGNVNDPDDVSDSIAVSFLGDSNNALDCLGGPLPATCQVGSSAATNSAKIYNAFYVEPNPDPNEDDKILYCAGSRSSSPLPIADGIENLQVLYGVDSDGDSFVDSYLNATAVNAVVPNDLWLDVVSIQLAILVRSSIEVKKTPEAETFTLLDTVYSVPTADRYQRAVFNTTISLRNSMN